MRLLQSLGCTGVQGRGVHVSLSPCLRPMDQQGAGCRPTPAQTLDSHVFSETSLVLFSPAFCVTRLEESMLERMEVREISHGSSPMIFIGSRCWWEYFVTVSGNAQSPIHTWAIRSEIQPSRSCPDPSAVHINVKLHQSPTHPPSQVFFYISLSLSNLYKCHFIMHLSSLGLFSPTFPPRCPPLCSDSARLFFSFHLDSIIPLLFQVILCESFLLSSSLRNHTIGLATSLFF